MKQIKYIILASILFAVTNNTALGMKDISEEIKQIACKKFDRNIIEVLEGPDENILFVILEKSDNGLYQIVFYNWKNHKTVSMHAKKGFFNYRNSNLPIINYCEDFGNEKEINLQALYSINTTIPQYIGSAAPCCYFTQPKKENLSPQKDNINLNSRIEFRRAIWYINKKRKIDLRKNTFIPASLASCIKYTCFETKEDVTLYVFDIKNKKVLITVPANQYDEYNLLPQNLVCLTKNNTLYIFDLEKKTDLYAFKQKIKNNSKYQDVKILS